ncbi:MAG: PAS domain-containing protein, partial [Clostridiales bacterium]|nr:PAS domain-containing protein [Clostridiales bacterium]
MGTDCNFSYEDFCRVIREYAPCMDNYLYVYDLANNRYYISPDAAERFAFDYNEFDDGTLALKTITVDEDYPALEEDMVKLMSGEHEWHDMTYRWHGRDGHDIWINCRGTCVRNDATGQVFMIGCINEVGKHQIADNQ